MPFRFVAPKGWNVFVKTWKLNAFDITDVESSDTVFVINFKICLYKFIETEFWINFVFIDLFP